jgi:hypothetical protein
MIEKITKNKDNLGVPDLHPIEKIKEKLNYYRELIPKLPNFSDKEIENLKKDITVFFTLKSVRLVPKKKLPKQLVRISNNNKILKNNKKPLNFLTEFNQILAPPKENCWYNRCNLPNEQVLYCATDLITAYWETKPKKGDVITIALYELKENANYNCSIIFKEKQEAENLSTALEKIFHLVEEFFIEIFTRKVPRSNAKEYIFSAIISSNQLFYPIESEQNIEAIMFPSVQRELNGYNVAIKNSLILDYYNLKGVKTAFVTKELENINPKENIEITENMLFEPRTTDIDLLNQKINHKKELVEKFSFLRKMQLNIILNPKSEVRYKNPIAFKVIQNLISKNRKIIDELKPTNDTLITIRNLESEEDEIVEFKNVRLKILGGMCEIKLPPTS